MLELSNIDSIRNGLKRIFSMRITRSTFREIQNEINIAVKFKETLAQQVLTAFLDESTSGIKFAGKGFNPFKQLISDFSIQIQVAKNIHEKGEFVNFITSDTLNRQQNVTFFNRIRRIDGLEYEFATDPGTTLQLMQHFLDKIKEIASLKVDKNTQYDMKRQLEFISNQIDNLITSIED